jgi:hypothetical protein
MMLRLAMMWCEILIVKLEAAPQTWFLFIPAIAVKFEMSADENSAFLFVCLIQAVV